MRLMNPDAAALLRAGRVVFRPRASDRDRVLQSLARTLGDAAVAGEASGGGPADPGAAPRFALGGRALLGGLAVLAVGAGLVLVAARPSVRAPSPVRAESAASPRPPVEPPPSLRAEAAPRQDEPALEAPPRLEGASASPRAGARPSLRPASDSLPEEVRLLSRAERQLNDGLAEDALETLGEHERRFPKGALAEERMAVRTAALCALGRSVDARVELAKLGRLFPRSPQLDAARRSCGVDRRGSP